MPEKPILPGLDADDYPVKLVRDQMLSKIGDGTLRYAQIEDRAEHLRLLRGKLVEEAVEYLLDPSAEEAADILQVLVDLAEVDPAIPGWHVVEEVRSRKLAERGGFRMGTIMLANVRERR